MIIQPNSTVKILKAVPLDDTYEHTVMFGSAAAQQSALSALAKHTLTGLTYQRLVPGKCRVGIKAEDLYDCNYMMYQNTSFGNKWFYAFIKSVEYINNECSEITFEIDALQTWLFDCSPGTCYVDRCHTSSDAIGEHTEPEPVSIGEYTFDSYQLVDRIQDLSIVVGIVDTGGESVAGNMYDGVYSGATLWGYSKGSSGSLNEKLTQYIQQPDAVTMMYMVPSFFIGNADGEEIPSTARSFSVTVDKPGVGSALNGYVPKNNKLYTYPYTFLYVGNGSGQSLSLRYEYFGDYPRLLVTGCATPPVAAMIRPQSYKGSSVYAGETLTISGYPMCSWSTNYFQSWAAQNTIPLALGALTGVAGGAVSNAAGIAQGNALSIAGFGINVLGTASSIASQAYTASIHADISRGNANNGGIWSAREENTFRYGQASITANYAKMIDDFFTRFGYHVGRIMPVNRTARPNFTYIRTIGVDMRGSVPADDMRAIANAYDKGITWWSSLGAVGNYGLSNKAGG